MFKEKILPKVKAFHVTGGDSRVFGEDAAERRKMGPKQVGERFAQVWRDLLEPEIRVAPIISLDEARELLEGRSLEYALSGYQYRQISIDSALFLVRLNSDASQDGVCDQLWSLGAHRDPTRLCVYFNAAEAKARFETVARRLGWKPQNLALQLLADFVEKFPEEDVAETNRRPTPGLKRTPDVAA
jgi:hypothetical protein